MNSIWLIPVFLKIGVANGIFPLILKRNVGLPSRPVRFFLQYFFCAVIIAIASFKLEVRWDGTFLAIMLLGFINGFGAYCQWRAIDLSLSKASLFTFWDDLIAMGLSYFILREGQLLNFSLRMGILISLAAVILFALTGKKEKFNTALLGYVLAYSFIFGFAMFFMKFAGHKGVNPGTFLTAWYFGAFASSLIFLNLPGQTMRVKWGKIGLADGVWMFLLALSIMASLFFAYWAYKLAPQNVVQPFFLIGEMILPTLIGLYLFREKEGLSGLEKIYFIQALAGGLLIALNY